MIDRFQRFSYAVFEITRCWHKIAADEMGKYGLKGPHAIYLMALADRPESITAAQLMELTGRDKADISRAIALMEQKGLVNRAGENPYRAPLRLTAEGLRAAHQVQGRVALAVELAGKDVSDENREIFYGALGSITENLHTLSKNGLP